MIIPVAQQPWHLDTYDPGHTVCGMTIVVRNVLWYCTRHKGHGGEHVALSGDTWCYAWKDLDPDLYVDDGL